MRLNKLKQYNFAEFLLLLLLSDFLAILAHIAFDTFTVGTHGYWLIDHDRSFGETFQYFKEFWLFCSFAILIKIRSEYSYLSFALLFFYLLVDDAFSLHERLGAFIAESLNFQPSAGLRSIDFGELIVSAIAGVFFMLLIGCSYWLGSQRFRSVCKRIAALVGCLAFFGIVVDMLHIMVSRVKIPFLPINGILGIVEDGGEMLVMSVMCWYGVCLLRQQYPSAENSSTPEPISLSPTRR